MKNVKVLWAIIILLFGFSGFLVNKFVSGKTEVSDDGRTNVILTKDERNLILDEMREFLVSVQGVSEAITNNDMAKVEKLGHEAGMAAEEGTPGALLQKIPLPMKQMGFAVRGMFDDISASAKETKDPLVLRKKLDTLMKTCIACHKTYRMPEPK